jgi:multimeric flavodoxin WrbA
MAMKVLFLNFTMEKSPRISSTQASVDKLASILKEPAVESQVIEVIEVIDYNVAFGVSSDKGEGYEYSPGKIKSCNISVIAASILFGALPSIAKTIIERQGEIYMEEYAETGQCFHNGKATRLIVTGMEGCIHDIFYTANIFTD